jgi:hypothetical protein
VYMSGTMVVRVDHHPEAGDPLNSGHYNRTQALRLTPLDSMDTGLIVDRAVLCSPSRWRLEPQQSFDPRV